MTTLSFLFSCLAKHSKEAIKRQTHFGTNCVSNRIKNQPSCSVEHLVRLLQTKWGHHQTQCYNFFGNYGLVVALCEYELVLGTQYKKPLNFTKSKHSKSYGCSFVHCCCLTTSTLGRHVWKSFKNPSNETWGKQHWCCWVWFGWGTNYKL